MLAGQLKHGTPDGVRNVPTHPSINMELLTEFFIFTIASTRLHRERVHWQAGHSYS